MTEEVSRRPGGVRSGDRRGARGGVPQRLVPDFRVGPGVGARPAGSGGGAWPCPLDRRRHI